VRTSLELSQTDTVTETGEATPPPPQTACAHHTVLYQIEGWLNGVRDPVVPIIKNEITIGRGSEPSPVDLPLNSIRVSRVHATLHARRGGAIAGSHVQKPDMINGQEKWERGGRFSPSSPIFVANE